LARGEPALDPVQVAANGAFTMHGSAVALVAASKRAEMVPRLLALRDGGVPLVFVIGEKNRGKFSSEQALRDAGLAQRELTDASLEAASGDIAFVPECGHGMHYDNPAQFWRVIAKIGDLFNALAGRRIGDRLEQHRVELALFVELLGDIDAAE
jgi:pimeloyl-ACP methyl ester carboxylesterase